MPPISVYYHFNQWFDYPAAEVFAWATDYRPDDIALFGMQGKRGVKRLFNDAVLLTDTFVSADGSRIVKKKLVRLYPKKLFWTNTHISGPHKYSQFLYALVPEGPYASRLEFSGQQVMNLENPTPRNVRALAAQLCKEDSTIWKRLARAMAASFKGRPVY